MDNAEKRFWDFCALIIIISFSFLQVLRSSIFPQFIDAYYHLLSAWGFLKAGGYSAWDFWQYAPVGRPHIYPPVYHLLLAFLLHLGANKIVLAKCFETAVPILFLCVTWRFTRRNYNQRLAFFVVVAATTSFSFYLSLCNNIPATLAILFGFYGYEQLFGRRFLRAILLLALCFYTHIGVSWFFAASILLFGLFTTQYRKISLAVVVAALMLAVPLLAVQIRALRQISLAGIGEKYFMEFKIVEYALAFLGLGIAVKKPSCKLFLAFFIASFVFLPYPYRFISAQGYLPIIFLSALALDYGYERLWNKAMHVKCAYIGLVGYCVLFSTTVLMEKEFDKGEKINYKVYFADTLLPDMLFPERNERIASSTLWFPHEYLPLAGYIRQHSQDDEIISSSLFIPGVALASLSERACANGLFPEISPPGKLYPFAASKLVILPKDTAAKEAAYFISTYHLKMIRETKMFRVYENPFCQSKLTIRKAGVSFEWIFLISFAFIIFFWQDKRVEKAFLTFFNFLLTKYEK